MLLQGPGRDLQVRVGLTQGAVFKSKNSNFFRVYCFFWSLDFEQKLKREFFLIFGEKNVLRLVQRKELTIIRIKQ